MNKNYAQAPQTNYSYNFWYVDMLHHQSLVAVFGVLSASL